MAAAGRGPGPRPGPGPGEARFDLTNADQSKIKYSNDLRRDRMIKKLLNILQSKQRVWDGEDSVYGWNYPGESGDAKCGAKRRRLSKTVHQDDTTTATTATLKKAGLVQQRT
jgi:hypothetical protein